jgi:hypothetical protein
MLTVRRQRSHECGSNGVSVSCSRKTSGQEICKISPRTLHNFGVILSPGPSLIAGFDKWTSGLHNFFARTVYSLWTRVYFCALLCFASNKLYRHATDHSRLVTVWRSFPPLLTVCLHGVVRINWGSLIVDRNEERYNTGKVENAVWAWQILAVRYKRQ